MYQCVLQNFSKGHKNQNKKKSCIGIDTPCTTREKERYTREKDIEKKLSLMVKKAGGIAVKFVSLGFQVYVIDSTEQIGGMLDELRAT